MQSVYVFDYAEEDLRSQYHVLFILAQSRILQHIPLTLLLALLYIHKADANIARDS